MRTRSRTLLMVLVPILALLAGACGAGDPTPTPTPPGPAGGTATPTPLPTPAPPTPTLAPASYPVWIDGLIDKFTAEPAANPPLSITEYLYQGNSVYFVPQRCCDIFSDLYDAAGNLIAHPDGGIAGTGDGRAPDFFSTRTLSQIIWQDRRAGEGRVEVLAPIVSVDIAILESFPLQYRVQVVSALPNACAAFARWEVENDRATRTFTVTLFNTVPSDPDTVCAQVYSTVNHSIPLEDAIERDLTYTVLVNDTTETFTGQ